MLKIATLPEFFLVLATAAILFSSGRLRSDCNATLITKNIFYPMFPCAYGIKPKKHSKRVDDLLPSPATL